MHVAELVLSWLVTTVLTFVVIILDERWMTPERLERAWPPSSRDAAIIAFGPLAILVHFLRTRGGIRTVRRVFLGNALGYLMGAAALIGVSLIGGVLINILLMLMGFRADWSVDSIGDPVALVLTFILTGIVVVAVWLVITIVLNAILTLLRIPVDWSLE